MLEYNIENLLLLLEMASIFMDKQLSSVEKKKNSKPFEIPHRILNFTCKFLNSMPKFIFHAGCTGIDLGFKISPTEIT
jgi:hypothetical protein